MRYNLYLDTAIRDNKIVKLLEGFEVVDEIISSDDEFVSIKKILTRNNITVEDVSKIDVNKGPGSFTGLKVGVTIANTFNYIRGNVKTWNGLILPEYGKEPNVSKPGKESQKLEVKSQN